MEHWDVIVVGAGAAGAILASRLAEDADRRVLLLEAGRRDLPMLHGVPILTGFLANHDIGVWRDTTEPEPGLGGRSIAWPRGRVLGGSSSINGMVWMRGRPADYDRWAAAGAAGWDWRSVGPAFEALERGTAANAPRDPSAPLRHVPLMRHDGDNPLFEAFLAAGDQAGHPRADDFNAGGQEGFGRFTVNIRDGRRMSSAATFLRGRRPGNLTVITSATARRLRVVAGRATAVVAAKGGREREYRGSEIVLSCGAVNTPKLLMLSGIGPAGDLRRLGIEVAQDLPGVGANLQDHVFARLTYECRQPVSLQPFTRLDRAVLGVARAWAFGTGVAARTPFAVGFLLRSQPSAPEPDIEGLFVPGLSTYKPWLPLLQRAPLPHGFGVSAYQLRPESRGRITLRSADPAEGPRIVANYLATEGDRRALRTGVRVLEEVIAQPAFDAFRGRRLAPDIPADPAAADAVIAQLCGTAYHPVGTCRMGHSDDPSSVTGPDLRVHGIENLRIADASVMPLMTSGNTHAPSMMIGYRCADLMRG
ncbi:choline dehydrogenase [Ancylobacter sp. 3268]|uniref:GMC family oxidoreductase n=1 Tax=Ancylobacter sp. 3268 TaxID=2817752 RepID=UPI00285C23A3|nr:GMC family oxidoreductase N-terminal domain-containing protein [Ancylobacter sp. 3268]MDR6954922.1 choline dehydrogenase [Ancylobacter sp. 3268]